MILQECYRVQHDDSANHDDNSLDLYFAKLSTVDTNLDLLFLFK